jgi:hypothetical protein
MTWPLLNQTKDQAMPTHMSNIGPIDVRLSPAARWNAGCGLPSTYRISINSRCNFCRCCRHCGIYDEGLMKVGLRSYAHKSCFEEKYGPIAQLHKPNTPF